MFEDTWRDAKSRILEEGRNRQKNKTMNDLTESSAFHPTCTAWQRPEATQALKILGRKKREVKLSEAGWLRAQGVFPLRRGRLSGDMWSW